MNKTNKLLIGALAAQVLLAIIILGRSTDTVALAPLQTVLPTFSPDPLTRIEIYRPTDEGQGDDITPAIILNKEEGGWMVATHNNYPADPESLTTLFDALATMQSRGPIADTRARHLQLRVAADRYLRKVVFSGADGVLMTLYVGQPAGGRATALRMDESDAIHAVTVLTPSTVPFGVVGWIDTTFFEVEARNIVNIRFENAAGSFEFERDGTGWKVLGDGAEAANEGRAVNVQNLDAMVRNLAVLKLLEPVDPRAITGSPLATVTLRVASEGAEGEGGAATEEHTLIIGPEHRGGGYVVRHSDGRAPVEISATKLELLVNFSQDALFR